MQFAARIRDHNGTELVQVNVNGPGAVLFNFQATIALPGPCTAQPGRVTAAAAVCPAAARRRDKMTVIRLTPRASWLPVSR